MMPGPLTRTSPMVPVGTSAPCSSTTATWTPCVGRPMEPGFLRPNGGFMAYGPVSVEPHCSVIATPVSRSKASRSLVGTRSPPAMQSRSRLKSQARNSGLASSCARPAGVSVRNVLAGCRRRAATKLSTVNLRSRLTRPPVQSVGMI